MLGIRFFGGACENLRLLRSRISISCCLSSANWFAYLPLHIWLRQRNYWVENRQLVQVDLRHRIIFVSCKWTNFVASSFILLKFSNLVLHSVLWDLAFLLFLLFLFGRGGHSSLSIVFLRSPHTIMSSVNAYLVLSLQLCEAAVLGALLVQIWLKIRHILKFARRLVKFVPCETTEHECDIGSFFLIYKM